jgi:hypothetical protein
MRQPGRDKYDNSGMGAMNRTCSCSSVRQSVSDYSFHVNTYCIIVQVFDYDTSSIALVKHHARTSRRDSHTASN